MPPRPRRRKSGTPPKPVDEVVEPVLEAEPEVVEAPPAPEPEAELEAEVEVEEAAPSSELTPALDGPSQLRGYVFPGRAALAIAGREIRSYVVSPVGYVLTAVLILIVSAFGYLYNDVQQQ